MQETDFKIELTNIEKIKCLEEIRKRIVRCLYVYEKSHEQESYNYKEYIKNLIIFISSANDILNGTLVNIKVNLNSILQNDFDKKQFKTIIFECKNYIDYLLKDGD